MAEAASVLAGNTHLTTRVTPLGGDRSAGTVGEVEDDSDGPTSPEEVRDELPSELDATGLVGPYLFPNNNRRRIPGALYLLMAVLALIGWAWARGGGSVLVNGGWLVGAAGLAIVGAYSIVSGWTLAYDEHEALVAAIRKVGFPVAYASAQMSWRGLLSRPTWRILLYSSEDPPLRRGLVLVDGVGGEVLEWFVEDNPEDWSGSGGA